MQEIANRVDPQDSEHVLHVSAGAIAKRVAEAAVRCASARREVGDNDEEQRRSDSEDVMALIHMDFDILDDTEHVNVEAALFSRESEDAEPFDNPERSRDTLGQADSV